ncbi:MAG TPA: AAA domain-containing protein, partial [Candidatus Brocadiaceae bacterium]
QPFPTKTTTPSTQLPYTEITSTWSPSKSRILNNITIPTEPTGNKGVTQKPDEFPGPWGTFRKLLGYYADCVENDEGCEASCYLEDYGKRFTFLNKVGYWYPQVGKTWRMHIPLGQNLQGFATNLSLLEESGVLLLGYPLQIWTKSDANGIESVFMKPIFTYQLTVTHDTNGFQITCDDPCPEVNLDWLNYAIKQAEHQRAFLAACGLMDRGQIDESFGDGSRFADSPDLKTLASEVIKFFSGKIREPLLPESVSSYFPKKSASGIYNKAVLMIGNRTRYTKTLLKELAQIASCSDEQLDQTALRFIFKNRDQNPDSFQEPGILQESIHESAVLETEQLNLEQRQCIESLLFENLTVVTGPPGTGKSRVVAVSMANARLRDQNVIFSSRNHKAIDAVLDRLVLDNGQPLVNRANSKKDPSLNFGFEEAIKQLLIMEYDKTAKDQWQKVQSRVMHLLQKRGEYGMQVDKIHQLGDRRGSIGQYIENISEDLSQRMIEELNIWFIYRSDTFPAKIIERLERSVGHLRVKKKVSMLDHFWGRFMNIFLRGMTNRLRN